MPAPSAVDDLDPTATARFLPLFAIESGTRALLSAIVPIHAYEVLGSALHVSILYACISALGLAISLLMPVVMHRLGRRSILTAAFVAGIVCGLALAWGTPASLVLALSCQLAMSVAFEAVINIYLMEQIPRRHLAAFESRRMLFAGVSFTLGPWLGVALDRSVMRSLSFLLAATLSALLLVLFWRGGITANRPPPARAAAAAPNPLRYIPRFVAQPRLVLAWFLAFGRSGWWVMFFIYTPIYVAAAGYPASLGGALVSIGLAPMLLIPLWARFARRHGLRSVLFVSFASVGMLTVIAGAVSAYPPLCLAMLVLAAWAATAIDVAGNVPFFRAVHAYERANMTSVFLTFRHATSLASPAMFAVALWIFPLGAVFVVAGLLALGIAFLTRFLPRSM